MSFKDYTPQSIGDIVFANDHDENLLMDIVNGHRPFPSGGKNGILLYGVYPSPHVPRAIEVKPALSWKSRVVVAKVCSADSKRATAPSRRAMASPKPAGAPAPPIARRGMARSR